MANTYKNQDTDRETDAQKGKTIKELKNLIRAGYTRDAIPLLPGDKIPGDESWPTKDYSSEELLERAARGANIGLRLNRLAVIDVEHSMIGEQLAEIVHREHPLAPIRSRPGSQSRAFLFRATDELDRWKILRPERIPGDHALLIELISGAGRQLHTLGTRKDAENARLMWTDIPSIIDLPELDQEGADRLARLIEEATGEKRVATTRASNGDQGPPETMPPDLLRRAIAAIPNDDAFMSRDDWTHMAHAIFGASGGSDWGLDIWLDWCERWESNGKSIDQRPEAPERMWRSIHDDACRAGAGFIRKHLDRVGAKELYAEAKTLGFDIEPESSDVASLNMQSDINAHYNRLTLTPADNEHPAKIPPRAWLYGRHYTRKYVSATVSTGGVGKSSLVLAEAIAMATGRSILEHHKPLEPLRVWWWCGEDPQDELQRRYHAVRIAHGVSHADLGSRFFFDSGRGDKAIKIAEMDANGTRVKINKALVAAITQRLIDDQIDVMVVDPFVSSHSCPENDNNVIDAVVKTWANIADKANCAIELIHHVRKNSTGEISADDARGASALKDACRDVRVLNRMTRQEAQEARVSRRGLFFRIDAELGKQNHQPPAEGAEWYRLLSVPLDNGTEKYPEGDNIGVVIKWDWTINEAPPTPTDAIARIQKAIPPEGAGTHNTARPWALEIIATALRLGSVHGRTNAAKDARKKAQDVLDELVRRRFLVLENTPARRRTDSKEVVKVGNVVTDC